MRSRHIAKTAKESAPTRIAVVAQELYERPGEARADDPGDRTRGGQLGICTSC